MTPATLTEELKPCPFDGAPAGFRWCGGVFIAECTKCGVSKSGAGISWNDDVEMTYEQREAAFMASAAAAWNRRAESRQEAADGVVKCEWCNGVGEVSVEDGNDCWDAPCPKCNGTGRASTHTDVAGHFPATSEPEQCCYRYTNGERCELRRDTHSFCISHAKQIRRALSAGEAK